MWPPKQIDIGWADLAAAFAPRASSHAWPDGTLVCLSVRSGFDLLLSALDLPPGSEVLMSALTIPDMPRIASVHGLVPVPVDLDLATLAPRPDDVEAALTPRTRAIVVAHLFGSRVNMQPVVEMARRRRLLVIEDLAQGWRGPGDRGHPDSDAAMFSFGPIKTATALGGALLQVRDPALFTRMQETHAFWPVQRQAAFLQRVLKYAAIKSLSSRPSYTAIVAAARLAHCDYDAAFARLVRGFTGPDLLARLRQRPSPALVSLLERRLHHYPASRLQRRAALAERLLDPIEGAFELPGRGAREHTHWVLPVLSDQPAALIRRLTSAGFHATQARSLSVVEPPAGRTDLQPHAARRLLKQAVFLPLYPELSEREIDRMAGVLLTSLAPTNLRNGSAGKRAFRHIARRQSAW